MSMKHDDKIPLFAPFFLAISFLSRFKTPAIPYDNPKVWRRSFKYYPLVGLLIGLYAAVLPIFCTAFLSQLQGILLASCLYYLFILEWSTRFLHFDGFCDCCDAFAIVTATTQKRLDVMKDPHPGAAAIGASILLFCAKTLVLYLLFTRVALWSNQTILAIALRSIPVFSRLTLLSAANAAVYPRTEGTAMHVVGKVPTFSCSIVTIFCYLLLMFLLGLMSLFGQFLTFSSVSLCCDNFYAIANAIMGNPDSIFEIFSRGLSDSVLIFLTCYMAKSYWVSRAKKNLGGVTGDVLGAVCETSELLLMIAFLFIADKNFI